MAQCAGGEVTSGEGKKMVTCTAMDFMSCHVRRSIQSPSTNVELYLDERWGAETLSV